MPAQQTLQHYFKCITEPNMPATQKLHVQGPGKNIPHKTAA